MNENSERGNLSAWALNHRILVLFMILAAALSGAVAYFSLGRDEDPSFTFRVMTIRTEWPGATAREVERLVTDPIQKKLEELPYYDFAKSYSKPGESVVFLNLKDSTPPAAIPDQWYQARKKIGDIKDSLPAGMQGPAFNDEFGDVYSALYAATGEGFSPAEMKKVLEEVRERLLTVQDVEKVNLLNLQDQAIYVEVSDRRLASYGIGFQTVIDAITKANAVSPAGRIDSGSDRIYLRIDEGFDSAAAVMAAPLQAGDRQLTVADVAEVKRGYVDPKVSTLRFDGKDALGLGVVMVKGGNSLALGKALDAEMTRVRDGLPAGVEITQYADQPKVVAGSIGEFVESLLEALAIVLAVSFLSLGWRTGIVVALAVPLVLALTMVGMKLLDIDLHRISAGALIIALGLLVDDAIIAVEMMVVKIEQGWDRLKAGAFAYTSTAFPMLTGTLVTVAGFVPVGFAHSAVAEYTNAIFWVVGLALILSWIVAVIFTPYLGYHLLPAPKHVGEGDHSLYDTPLYRRLRRLIAACLKARWLTIGVTAGAFLAALGAFGLVQQQFFPSSNRPELVVDLRLAEGSAYAATDAEARKLEAILKDDPAVVHVAAYVGDGSPHFYLAFNQELQNANFAQFVVMTKGIKEREALRHRLEALAETSFPAARLRAAALENGPPVGYAVQFRVIGGDPAILRGVAYRVRDLMRADPNLTNVNLDWDELSKRVRVEIDPTKARALGVNKQDLAQSLNLLLAGTSVTKYREGTELIDVVARTPDSERLDLAHLADLDVGTTNGTAVPLGQVATIGYELEEPVLWRRGRQTTMTVRADVAGNVQAPDVSQRINAELAGIRASLPDGYRIDMGGAIEESAKGSGSIVKMLPIMGIIMVTVLMIQLQSFSRLAMVLLSAPLGLIGVTLSLLLSGLPFGFVALLGVTALAGIIMRNSVILIDQIDQDIAAGHAPWDAVIDATVRRARPIALTAAAAILAMIPLAQSIFWAPMAVSMMGGLAGATLLTLLFLPALYAAWFGVRQPGEAPAGAAKAGWLGGLRSMLMGVRTGPTAASSAE